MLIRKARKTDEIHVLTLLSELNEHISPDSWQLFFDYCFSPENAHYGYVLDVDGSIEGFIGTIISDREYNGRRFTCCNIHGWIVRPRFKSYSLKMLAEVLKEDMVFTNFSSMETTYMILKRMDFNAVDHDFRICRPVWSGLGKNLKIRKVLAGEKSFTQEENAIVIGHLHLKSHIVEVSDGNERCLIVMKPEYYCPSFLKTVSFVLPVRFRKLMKIEYIGNPSVFNRAFRGMALRLSLLTGNLGYVAPRDVFDKADIRSTTAYFGKRRYMYRSIDKIGGQIIPDTLFSELFVLNLPG